MVLIIIDCTEEEWQEMMSNNNWDSFMLRDDRYDQIIHMVSHVTIMWYILLSCHVMQVTAAKGAEKFYQTSNNPVRGEGVPEAIERDSKFAQVRGKGGREKEEKRKRGERN